MLPPVARRQHWLTLFVGVVAVEKKRYLGVCAYVNAGSTFWGFCFPASSSVPARSRHVRSFVAGAINSLQCAAPVVLPFADTPGASLVLYAYSACCGEILTLPKCRSLLLNISPAFTSQVSNVKGKFHQRIHTSVPRQLHSPWTWIGRRGT